MTITITITDNPAKPGFCDLTVEANPPLCQRMTAEERDRPAGRAMYGMLAAQRKPASVTLKQLEYEDGTIVRPKAIDPSGN